jgi:hypothetical protein
MTTPQEEPNDSSAKNEDAANNVPSEITIPSELLAQLPPEVAEALQSNLTSVHGRITSQSLTVQARPFDPIAEKVSPELISEYMGHRARETEQEFAERRHSRLLYSGVGLIVLGALFAFIITLILLRETSLIGPILASIATGIGGAGVAIGLAQSHRR